MFLVRAVVWVGRREQRAFWASLIWRNCKKRKGEKPLEWVALMSHLSFLPMGAFEFPNFEADANCSSLACKAGTACILMAALWWGGRGQLVMREIH